MIEWKPYDRKNPPPMHYNYLVFDGQISTAWLDYISGTRTIMFYREGGAFHTGITHYAEVNFPE